MKQVVSSKTHNLFGELWDVKLILQLDEQEKDEAMLRRSQEPVAVIFFEGVKCGYEHLTLFLQLTSEESTSCDLSLADIMMMQNISSSLYYSVNHLILIDR